jgi:diguanylate cyclase (GGDEF)-like protein
MPTTARLSSLASRLWQRSDPERNQALARVIFVAGAMAYAFSSLYATHAPNHSAYRLGQWTAMAAGVVSALILLSFRLWPGESRTRRVIGISHDIAVISVTLVVGEQATAYFSVVYLVIILASGVRYGAGYMAFAAVGCLLGFALVHGFSPYWQANFALSLNLILVLAVVPAYMYRLIYHRQQSRQELERRALHDSLTGLMNRAGFEQKLEESVMPGAPDQVLIYFDLDRFKEVNDKGGHAAGDMLLADVAHIVRDCVRSHDICGRIGGDEFCIFLQGCSLGLGEEIAGRIKDRIHSNQTAWRGNHYAVDASIGVVSSLSAEDGPAFLRLADAACYAAKNAGRNQIYVVDTARMRLDTARLRTLRTD